MTQRFSYSPKANPRSGLAWRWLLLGVIILITIAAVIGATILPIVLDPRIRLGDRQPLEKQHYTAFAQPWAGAEHRLLKHWAAFADRISVDLVAFPANTEIGWLWPWEPHGAGPGVWGYDFVAYGQYDGGSDEVAITPRRVRDITQLQQTYAWSRSILIGDANVMTEFYLRSHPTDSDSKIVEIGWFLHTPSRTREFVDRGRQIGIFTDGQKRQWRVSMDDKYCTLMPIDGKDLPEGSIDMLEAIHWLQSKHIVPNDAWFTGVALGVEPIWGAGAVQIKRWAVAYK